MDRTIVTFSDVWPKTLDGGAAKCEHLPIFLGNDLVVDLARMPHLLVGGADGWGKTNLLNCMICGLARLLPPERLQFVLMDTKLVEFVTYGKFKHLAIPVSHKESECIAAFNWLAGEMERRLKVFAKAGCCRINDYHEQGNELPYIVAVVDEFADLIAKHGKEIEPNIERLANYGRASGIHLVMATGVLDREIVTLSIRRSLKGRIAFKTLGEEQSRLLIDVDDAMSLCERGDMLVRMPDDTLAHCTCGFLSAQEQDKIIEQNKIVGTLWLKYNPARVAAKVLAKAVMNNSLGVPFLPGKEGFKSIDDALKHQKQLFKEMTGMQEPCDEQSILGNLRILHKELGKQISEIENDPEEAAAALQGIHADIEAQLDALDNVLENNRQSAKNEK